MKLIDILVRELPKRGGWPKGAYHAWCDRDGEIRFRNGGCKPDFYPLASVDTEFRIPSILHEDDGKYIVTESQYEAALAASKAEWNGERLPPVGSRAEVKADDFEGGWLVIDVVCVHNGGVVGIVQSENEYLNDRLEKFSAGYNRAEFRPIRSEADKKRDAACKVMEQEWKSTIGKSNYKGELISVHEIIYDAIAAGKIPGVKLED